MRRLYSTFTGGRPGLGLLLMRLVLGSVLLARVGPQLWTDPLPIGVASLPLAGAALLLLAGLWTPLAGAVVALMELSRILKTDTDPVVCLLAATVAVALAMLGPGRWSVDAQLFGWRRIDAPTRSSGSNVRGPVP